jgi:hypothetical protein
MEWKQPRDKVEELLQRDDVVRAVRHFITEQLQYLGLESGGHYHRTDADIPEYIRTTERIEHWCIEQLGEYIADARELRGVHVSLEMLVTLSHVSYINAFVHNEIVDALGNVLFNSVGHRRVVLLVDPFPTANWGHPCWIATYQENGHDRIKVVMNDSPPMEQPEQRLVRVE